MADEGVYLMPPVGPRPRPTDEQAIDHWWRNRRRPPGSVPLPPPTPSRKMYGGSVVVWRGWPRCFHLLRGWRR